MVNGGGGQPFAFPKKIESAMALGFLVVPSGFYGPARPGGPECLLGSPMVLLWFSYVRIFTECTL